MLEALLIIALGTVTAIMANLGIAVFNDGLRPIVPENLEGRMSRKELGVTAFAMSFGLVIGYGLPISISASILLIHSILLGTDIIGLVFKRGKWSTAIAGVLGGVYGAGIYFGLQAVVKAFEMLPLNFIDGFNKIGEPVVVSFMVFPALAIALQFSVKKGVIAFLAAALVRQIAVFSNTKQLIQIDGTPVVLSPEGIALIVGMVFLIVFAMKEKSDDQSLSTLASMFTDRVTRIKKFSWVIMISGGLAAAATNLLLIAGDPISLSLLADGKIAEGGIAALAKAIGFVPLIASTAIATGVFGPVGFTFVFGDEPSMGLAPQLVEQIFEIVKAVNEGEGTSFLLAEQNTNVALRYAHYGYILENGRVVMDGPAADLRENPDVKEFYLGMSDDGRKSFRDVRSYRRRKRWLA